MRTSLSLATVSLAVLALAACGGPPESANEAEPAAAATSDAAAATAPAAAASGTPAAGEEVPATGETPAADASPTPAPSASASAAARPAAAAQVAAAAPAGPPSSFTICTVCHSVNAGQNMVGPSLAGIVGKKAGSASGFAYSAGMKATNVTWTEANLRRYLVDPNAVVPGGSMPAPGVNAQQAGEIVAYLKTL